MSSRHLVTVAKLAIVGTLMAFVLTNVQWDDRYLRVDNTGEVVEERSGEIIGRWDEPEVRFQPTDEFGRPSGSEIVVDQTDEESGKKVSPGFTTFILNLDWLLFVVGALCYCLSVNLSAVRWWWLLRVNALQVSWWTAIRYTWIGVFFNNVMPGQTGGDLVKALYIMKRCEGGRLAALVSVLVDRVLGLGSLALLGAFVVLFALDKEGFGTVALGIWGVLVLVGLLGVVAFSKRIRRRVKLGPLLRRLPASISGILQRVDQAVHFYRGHKTGILLWMVVGVGNHAVSVAATMLIGEALGVGMPPLEYFVLVPVINILSAFPITPNGWGVGEFFFKYLFGTFGAPHLAGISRPAAEFIMGTRGVALSLLWRIHLTLWSLVGGIMVLFESDRVTRKDIAKEVALEADESEPVGA